MSLNEKDMPKFKKWLKSHLKIGEVSVTFIKKDGSERVMTCTTNPTYIMFKEPESFETTRTKTPNPDVMPVYDIEAEHWKSFRWDSIKSVSITFGGSNAPSDQIQ